MASGSVPVSLPLLRGSTCHLISGVAGLTTAASSRVSRMASTRLVSGANASSGSKNCNSTHPKSCSFAPKTTSSPLSASMASSPGALEKNSPLVAPRQSGDLRGQAPTPRCVTWCSVRLLRSMFAILSCNEPLRLEVEMSSWATASCGRRSLASMMPLRFCLTATMLRGGVPFRAKHFAEA